MNKKILYMTIIMIVTLSILTVSYAAVSLTFTATQTLTVPALDTIMTVYDVNNDVTLVNGANITDNWVWKSDSLRYELNLTIHNISEDPITPTLHITPEIVPDWTFVSTPTSIGLIPAGGTLPIVLTMTPETNTTTTTDLFTLYITLS